MVEEFDCLHLIMNENLNWKAQINKAASKISKSMGILNSIKQFLSISAKFHIYNALILSHLNFGILAWGHQCERIVKFQKKPLILNESPLEIIKKIDTHSLQGFSKYNKILEHYNEDWTDEKVNVML